MSGQSHHSAGPESETRPAGERSSTKREVRVVEVGEGKGHRGGKEECGGWV